jgi:segregation and condensation protein B
MTNTKIRNVLEAALLAAGRPLTAEELHELFDEHERPELALVLDQLTELQTSYAKRGIELKLVASGYRIQIRESVVNEVSKLWAERPVKYTRAFLETLALIAYRQPITRGEIEDIRGVAVNPNIIRTLQERNWVKVIGHREVPGRPELLATTKDFLDYFNLRSLDELPTLAELKDFESLGVQLDIGGPLFDAKAAQEFQQLSGPDALGELPAVASLPESNEPTDTTNAPLAPIH